MAKVATVYHTPWYVREALLIITGHKGIAVRVKATGDDDTGSGLLKDKS
ncbi:rCG33824 [Rattus norvegicus]|uniref:RCG33824 n=1 Tax=Rattus norvegicus TaxID=10116 RepID=A6HDF1_RAT|nr:rCG33824 [Rattus norvegicus]